MYNLLEDNPLSDAPFSPVLEGEARLNFISKFVETHPAVAPEDVELVLDDAAAWIEGPETHDALVRAVERELGI
ncbi:hypothetical protein [Haloferula sp. BvORR071]|uniref:hypothetical protein n=1 Tax=Haloferula sp. BvORR071 TaxID=1396141 RepID=UPI000555A35E|nr:hypothetical protein [Haloferula sp. BvORR071]